MNFRKANKNDKSICSEILKDAFKEYDFFKIYVDNQKRREKFFNIMMEIWMKNSFKYGNVLVAEENQNIVAVTVLKAPNEKDINFIDRSFKSIKMFLIGGIKVTRKFLKMCKISDEACHRLPNPKWHLVLLAVSSKCKGKGIGSAMIQKCIIPYIAKNGGGLLALNTNTENNRQFYKKNSFNEFDGIILHENGKELGNWSYKMKIEPQ